MTTKQKITVKMVGKDDVRKYLELIALARSITPSKTFKCK